MKKIFAILLAAMMVLSLAACSSNTAAKSGTAASSGTSASAASADTTPAGQLNGTWAYTEYLTADDMQENLSFVCELNDSEIQLASLDGCAFTVSVRFDSTGKTYTYGPDAELTRKALRSYFDGLFTTLYEHRTEIAEYEGEADDFADKTAFGDWRASILFGGLYTSYDELLTGLADTMISCYDFTCESGSYTADGSNITFTASDASDSAAVPYTLSGDTLTIQFSDGAEQFSRVAAE